MKEIGLAHRGGLARRSAMEIQAGLRAVARNSEVSERVGGSNSVVESQPSKLLVAGSIPVSRSILRSREPRASFGWQATEALNFDWRAATSAEAETRRPTCRPKPR
jgi:hypothetical protein